MENENRARKVPQVRAKKVSTVSAKVKATTIQKRLSSISGKVSSNSEVLPFVIQETFILMV